MAPPSVPAYQDNPWNTLVHAFVQLLVACLVLFTAGVSLLTSKLIKYFESPHPCSFLGLHHERSRLCDEHRRSLVLDRTCVECLRATRVLPLYSPPAEETSNRYVKQLYDRDRDRESLEVQDKLLDEDQRSCRERLNEKGGEDLAEPGAILQTQRSFLRHGLGGGDRCVKRKFAKVFVEERGAKSDHDHQDIPLKDGKGGDEVSSFDGEFLIDSQPPAGEPGAGKAGEAEISVESVKAAFQAEKDALGSLYAELEEERNASAIAANEAMAMITRLQEEKAAVQMEARQYQRMVEEKAVYDQEAITLLKEILFKREQEKFVLEKEVESYRRSLLARDDWNEPSEDEVPLSLTFRAREDAAGLRGTNLLGNFESAWSPRSGEEQQRVRSLWSDEEVPAENGEASLSPVDENDVRGDSEDIDLRTSSMVMRDNFRLAMEEDIRELTSRLQVLEDDRKMMRQIVHSIKAEKQELRELAESLRELRTGPESRDNSNEAPTVPQVWSLAKKRRMEQGLANL